MYLVFVDSFPVTLHLIPMFILFHSEDCVCVCLATEFSFIDPLEKEAVGAVGMRPHSSRNSRERRFVGGDTSFARLTTTVQRGLLCNSLRLAVEEVAAPHSRPSTAVAAAACLGSTRNGVVMIEPSVQAASNTFCGNSRCSLSHWPLTPTQGSTLAQKLERKLVCHRSGDHGDEGSALSVLQDFAAAFPRSALQATRITSFFANLEDQLESCAANEVASTLGKLRANDKAVEMHCGDALQKWRSIASCTNAASAELVDWMKHEHAVIIGDVIPSLKAIHVSSADLVHEDDRMASLKRRVAHLQERRDDVGQKITHIRNRQSAYQQLVRTNFALINEISLLKEVLTKSKERLEAQVGNERSDVFEVIQHEIARAGAVKSLAQLRQQTGKKARLAASEIEMEAASTDAIRCGIETSKRKAESEVVERSGSLTPRPDWNSVDLPEPFLTKTSVLSSSDRVAQLAQHVERQTLTTRYLQEEVNRMRRICTGVLDNTLTVCGFAPAAAASIISRVEQHYCPPRNLTLPLLPVPHVSTIEIAAMGLWLWRHVLRLMGDAPFGDSSALILESPKMLFSPLVRRHSSVFVLGAFLEEAGFGGISNGQDQIGEDDGGNTSTGAGPPTIEPSFPAAVQRPEEDIIADTLFLCSKCAISTCTVGFLASKVFSNKLPARLYDIAAITMDTFERILSEANSEKRTELPTVVLAQSIQRAYAERRLNVTQSVEAFHVVVSEQLIFDIGPPKEFSWESHKSLKRLFAVVLRHSFEEHIELVLKLRQTLLSSILLPDKGEQSSLEFVVGKLELELAMQSMEFGENDVSPPSPSPTPSQQLEQQMLRSLNRSPTSPSLTSLGKVPQPPLQLNSALLIEHLAGALPKRRGVDVFEAAAEAQSTQHGGTCNNGDLGSPNRRPLQPTVGTGGTLGTRQHNNIGSTCRDKASAEVLDLALRDVVDHCKMDELAERRASAKQSLLEANDYVDASEVFSKIARLPLRLYLH